MIRAINKLNNIYDKYNYKEVYSYDNKEDYLDELFKLLFDWF